MLKTTPPHSPPQLTTYIPTLSHTYLTTLIHLSPTTTTSTHPHRHHKFYTLTRPITPWTLSVSVPRTKTHSDTATPALIRHNPRRQHRTTTITPLEQNHPTALQPYPSLQYSHHGHELTQAIVLLPSAATVHSQHQQLVLHLASPQHLTSPSHSTLHITHHTDDTPSSLQPPHTQDPNP